MPKVQGMTEDEAQDALADRPRVRRVDRPLVRGGARRADPGQRPAGRHDPEARHPRGPVHQQGPAADPGKDFTGRDADTAERVLEGRGLTVDRSRRSTPTPSPRVT